MTQGTTFWRSIEAIHDVVYFAPDAKQRYEAIGLKGYWMGYMASRSAAVGTPPPELVVALFQGFAPRVVERALPDAWSMASRDDILGARYELARAALATALSGADAAHLAAELAAITRGIDFAGKPLAAAHQSLPEPADDAGRLWHAATVIREYRGDCHVAVLTSAGLDGAAANALAVAAGLAGEQQRSMRGWTEDEWAAATSRLVTRGWVDPDGAITETGRSARQQIEDATDRVCAAGLDREATGRTITIEEPLLGLARAVEASGAVSYPNPTGVRRP
ncbi:MarR family transcriptional regulator [Aeromicrobium sp. NPDC092404]|uniref:SCO6745 family protein n=1 Tax=Aeromicrobium sp. NPDC092404 TaxID=3154976 RepID=UPI0034390E2D